MEDAKRTVVGLGELLWDLLPSGKQLGGAPCNFAYITSLLGDAGIPASRVGGDSLGDEALRRLTHLGLTTAFVHHDSTHPTGLSKSKSTEAASRALTYPSRSRGTLWTRLPPGSS